jgi:hypothetical protein
MVSVDLTTNRTRQRTLCRIDIAVPVPAGITCTRNPCISSDIMMPDDNVAAGVRQEMRRSGSSLKSAVNHLLRLPPSSAATASPTCRKIPRDRTPGDRNRRQPPAVRIRRRVQVTQRSPRVVQVSGPLITDVQFAGLTIEHGRVLHQRPRLFPVPGIPLAQRRGGGGAVRGVQSADRVRFGRVPARRIAPRIPCLGYGSAHQLGSCQTPRTHRGAQTKVSAHERCAIMDS